MRGKLFYPLLLTGFVSSYAYGQEMRPLADILRDEHEETYPLVRCGGFYLANVEWAGQALDEATFDQTVLSIEKLLLVASIVRQSKNSGSFENATSSVQSDVRAVSNFYLNNYRQNYAATGTAWDGNALWKSDAASCKPLTEAAMNVASSIEGTAK